MGQFSGKEYSIDAKDRFLIVQSRFNEHITAELARGCAEELYRLGAQEQNVRTVEVPGAFELPIAAKWGLENGYDAAICLGAVIRGDTPHFDYVCDGATQGCIDVQVQTGKPVVFGLLTCDTLAQAFDRTGGQVGHKGEESAQVAAEMLALRRTLEA